MELKSGIDLVARSAAAAAQASGDGHAARTDNPHAVTAAQTGAPTSGDVAAAVAAHANRTDNPHAVTAAQTGGASSGDVAAAVAAHANRTDNPHAVTAAQAGAIPAAEKGAASGVATLGADGQLTPAQALYLPGDHWLGGGPFTSGVIALTNTNGEAGTWADVTAALINKTSGDVTLFPGLAAENCLYIGADLSGWTALRWQISTPITLGAGAVAVEIWNGAAWVSNPIMETGAASPYTPRANSIFTAAESIHHRLGNGVGSNSRTLNGSAKYWIRFRITTAITTAPVAAWADLIKDATLIHDDGVAEFFGAARPVETIMPMLTSYQTRYVNAAAPGTASISYATSSPDNLVLQGGNNSFADGSSQSLGYNIYWAGDWDSSAGVDFSMAWGPQNNSAGNVEIGTHLTAVKDGDVLTTASRSAALSTRIFAAPGIARQRGSQTWAGLSAEGITEGGSWVVAISRDARLANINDTYPGAVEIEAIKFSTRRWRA